MRNLKKALSVFLCIAMMFTTLCFFPVAFSDVKASAAVVNTDNETAFYVPEIIYLYPDVTSWKSSVKTPFQYYVNNTVDTENIYDAPKAEANLDNEGKIYFAAREGMSDVDLSVKFLDLSGNYMDEASFGTVNFTTENKGDYYLITVTDGVAPELAAATSGCYIEWCLTYKNTLGEKKAIFNYSYIYKPYVVPYGAAVRMNNTRGDVNVYAQHITWVTGVHSVDTSPAQTNTLYPRYIPVSSAVDSSDDTRGEYPFSPFLSRDNKAYVGGIEVSGAAPVKKGGYNAVFAGTDADTAYFWANQSGAAFSRSYRAREFFYTAATDATYPVAFDYINNSSVTTQYALSQVTPTKTGSIKVDISRYNNLKDIPNLAAGMLVTDTDVKDAVTTNVSEADVIWYIGDGTGRTHLATGAYDTLTNINSAKDGVYVKFASEKDIKAPLTTGIWYAGEWNKELSSGTGNKTYTLKSYYEATDRENDRQAASAAINLNVNQVDKSYLRATVDRAVSHLGTLGVKENWNSYYYDVDYIDPDTGMSAWRRFQAAYINACGALGNADIDLPITYDEYALELERSLDALLAGKGLRVYFDVNHDDIGVNLWINPNTGSYVWNADNQTVLIDGNFNADVQYGTTPFTPAAGQYTFNINQISGTYNAAGCIVFDAVDINRSNVTNSAGYRYNLDFEGSKTQTLTYEEANAANIEGLKFWSWYYDAEGTGVYNNLTLQIKIEKGNKSTEYSPVGKITGATYGTLPTPTREGYLFAGWCTDESLNTVVDENSAVSSRILYAKWEKAQYNVVFDGNGADGGEMSEQTLLYDEASALNTNSYTRTGYVFAGWKDADGNSYTDAQEVLNLTSEHQGKYTLYAQWTPNQYSVAFDGNTGLGGLGMTNAQYDTPFELPANYFIKTGYTFMGWATSPDGEAIYSDCEKVSNLTSDVNGSVTLYAIWKANTFTVKFDKNSAEGSMADALVTYDSEVSLPACGFTKTGYTFMGWSLAADSTVLVTDAEYDNLRTENNDEVTLYAVWSENSYTLSFDMNGGEGEKINPTVYGYEDEVLLPRNVFTKTGYILSGWSLTKDGEKVYENGETVKHIASGKNDSVTLYAVWTPVTYTVKFDSNDASGTMESLSMVYNTEKALAENTFTKEGYHFLGWSTVKNGAVEYHNGASVKNLASTQDKEVILYAVWEINTYTVTFNYRNTKGEQVSSSVTVKHNEAAVVPNDFTLTPMKNATHHYIFSSWSADITHITSDLTVNARYPSASDEAHDMSVTVVDSTCLKVGQERHFCTKCGYEYFIEIAKKNHVFDSGTVQTEPGCTTSGTRIYSCSNCTTTKAEAIAPTGHTFVSFPASEPTCSKEGNIAHKHCEKCKNCFSSDALTTAPDSEALTDAQVKIPTLPHTPGAPATCTTAETCTVCGAVITAALGHEEKTEYITSTATCVTEGTYIKKITCTVCNTVVSEVTETGTIPHTYEETVTEPDCTNKGYTTYKCSVCSHSYTGNETPEKGHTEGTWEVTTEPGCITSGERSNYCSVCDVIWKTEEIEATGHDSGEWKITTPAECEEWGTQSLICTVCDAVLSTKGIAPKGHGETETKVTLEPGCETAGRRSVICKDCGKELSFTVIPESGHTPDGPASCEKDSVCTGCGEILAPGYPHRWNDGKVTKEPTETEEGIITYTCINDPSHTKTEAIPVRIVIVLPEIPEDGTYDLDAAENGYAGNIHYIISVEEGMEYTVTSSAPGIVTIDSEGNITVKADGEAVFTITTADGKFEKSFTVTARTIKTVTFDIRGNITTVKAYAGDKVTPPTVDSYESGGFTFNFKTWTVNGVATDDYTVTGDMTFVAEYTSSCDYTQLDKLTQTFYSVISGTYNNAEKLKIYKNEIDAAKAKIDEFSKDRNTRDASEQDAINAAADEISALISALYPEENARIFIVCDDSVALGSVSEFKAYLSPLNTIIANGIWTSSDDSVGFFANGKFHAVKSGTITITVSVGNLSASKEITVNTAAAGARVIMFDTLLSNANYIVENNLIIKETTNLFWAPAADIHFRVITDGTFEEYYVYVDGAVITPDEKGTYTIPGGTGDAHVKVEGVVKNEEGTKLSFLDMLRDFFMKIAEFFRNLFSFG